MQPRPAPQTELHQPTVLRLAGLAVDSHGVDDDRPPLVLVHGLTFERRAWAPVVQALGNIDPHRRVLVIDLPGHGASPALPSHDAGAVVDAVQHMIVEAGLQPPVMVGHSLGAVIATVFAARHPASGVVNIDQPLQVAGFASLLHSLAGRLRGPDFAAMWDIFRAGFHTELLPPGAQELVRSTSHPDQQLVLGYWQELLDLDPTSLQAYDDANRTGLHSLRCPYLLVVNEALDPATRQWLDGALPQATVAVWPNTGHFPHLAHPQLFADYLAATDRWTEPGY